ncbi:pentapeptide repeat-containing protein [Nostoc muscorum FACHB-395]|nr:pentapeptide repeat-containing protein [Desmonostoc muscorum FACHB-395]
MPQDFSGQNLRGRSFKGQNLEGANFSYADIRSADFTGANLRNANFSHAKAGLKNFWMITLLIASCLLLGVSSCTGAIVGYYVGLIFKFSEPEFMYIGIASVATLITLLTIITWRGTTAILGILALVVAVVGTGVFVSSISINSLSSIFSVILLVIVITYTGTVVGAGAFGVIFRTIGKPAIILSAIFIVGFAFVIWHIVSSEWLIRLLLLINPEKPSATWVDPDYAPVSPFGIVTRITALVTTLAVPILATYIGWCSIGRDKKYILIQELTVNIAATRGTSFRKADLTDANFTNATLKGTDFKNTLLIRTCFRQSKMLKQIRPGKSYLKNLDVCELLVTGLGQGKNFDRQDLRGANFKCANLANASFIGADLSQANLQDADLSRSKLKQTQLDGTDFTGANLTGAYIQDWGITTDTKFDGVRCEYVYMRLPTKENPDPLRKPDNHKELFADGEFGDFIQPIFDTLDLYHNQGVDPRAIAISFKQLAENHPDAELEIVAMEKRGQDKFLLRAKTALEADKSQLSAEYFDLYNQYKALPKADLIYLLAQKDGQVQSLEIAFRAVTRGLKEVAETPKKQSNFNLQGAQFAGGLVDAETVTANQIGGNITNYTPEQKQNLAQAAAEIQQLLNQLGQTYPTNTPLEKQIVVTEVLKEIERNPTLKARVIGALKAGGTEALKELLDHPAVNVLLAALEGWQDAE